MLGAITATWKLQSIIVNEYVYLLALLEEHEAHTFLNSEDIAYFLSFAGLRGPLSSHF